MCCCLCGFALIFLHSMHLENKESYYDLLIFILQPVQFATSQQIVVLNDYHCARYCCQVVAVMFVHFQLLFCSMDNNSQVSKTKRPDIYFAS